MPAESKDVEKQQWGSSALPSGASDSGGDDRSECPSPGTPVACEAQQGAPSVEAHPLSLGGDSASAALEDRVVTIVTTAALPWLTGTSVNPLLRAAFLAKNAAAAKVTLLVPWLARAHQELLYPGGLTFASPKEQEQYMRGWQLERSGFEGGYAVAWYPAQYLPEAGSIFAVGDLTRWIPDEEADVAILEEPDHLNWFHAGRRWTHKFRLVLGIVHTNYEHYVRQSPDGGDKLADRMRFMVELCCRSHCHKVIKLSDALPPLPKAVTLNVHGAAPAFLAVGRSAAAQRGAGGPAPFSKGAYFMGKAVWGKGYHELIDVVEAYQAHLGLAAPGSGGEGEPAALVDCFGSGEDEQAIREEAAQRGVRLAFHGGRDHIHPSLSDYAVFVNPSTSDVVATTTAEALALGKWVVCLDHPSNAFFAPFTNCLTYRTPEEFCQRLDHALSHDPQPLAESELRQLGWDAATDRLLGVLGDCPRRARMGLRDSLAWRVHKTVFSLGIVRAKAGLLSRKTPASLEEFDPSLRAVHA